MKKPSVLVFACLWATTILTGNPVAPLEEKVWSNPEFVKSFLGSFGVQSEVEPKIGRNEQVLFEDVAKMLEDDRISEVIDELKSEFDEIDSNAAVDFSLANFLVPVSYSHLTLPTIYSV